MAIESRVSSSTKHNSRQVRIRPRGSPVAPKINPVHSGKFFDISVRSLTSHSIASPLHTSLVVEPQPTETSCGPTCLRGVYQYLGLEVPVEDLIEAIPSLAGGGTLAVMLGVDALKRGFGAKLYSCNLRVLDPSWFPGTRESLRERLRASHSVRKKPKDLGELKALELFLDLGGDLRMEPLTRELIRRHLNDNRPILTGLSSTFLYRDKRTSPLTGQPDDLAGQSEGHFVVLSHYDRETRTVTVNDPWPHSPFEDPHRYHVHIDRLINAILLGVLSYDANLLVLSPHP